MTYADCPDSLPVGADPGNWICDNIVIGGGTMTIGSIEQPLTKPISMTVQSGFDPATGETRNIFVKMRSQQETVPGGVLGDTCYIGSKSEPVKLNLEGDNDTLKWYDDSIGMTMNDTSFAKMLPFGLPRNLRPGS
ncbi:hypothetical protein [Actinomadura nitritigenes]|uniref:hypothetical protein n=1 Tax=Actinomadura nitritigenes TaxID=134602 RepID=UPI003D8ABD90